MSTGGRWSGSLWLQDLPEVGAGPLVVCSLVLSALLLCSRCVACKYAFISRFKGVFRGFYGVCVGLCCSGALRGLWGFCVRERLGGFRACCVFASVYPFFIFFAYVIRFFSVLDFLCLFSGCPSLLWLSFFVLLHCLCGSLGVVVGFSFSLSDKTKKERIRFALFLYLVLVSLF